MQTRSQTRRAAASALRIQAVEQHSFETRRSKRLQELGYNTYEPAVWVAEWLNSKDYDSDNDSTSTYNTEDADAATAADYYWFNNDEYEQEEPIRLTRSTTESQQISPYNTRSTASRREYEVNIDFDEASRAWRANKRRVGEGHFQYFCPCSNQRNATRNREGVQTRSMSIAK